MWKLPSFVLMPFFCLTICSGLAFGQTESKPGASAIQLQPVFSDDFSKDTRSDYVIDGDVTWDEGELTLAQGASITRAIDGGAWAKVDLDFGEQGWDSGDEKQELRIRFLLDGATDCFVRLRKRPNGEEVHTSSVALVDTGEQAGEPITRNVREITLAASTLTHLSLEYRYGVVSVADDQSVLLTAYIENGAAAVIGSTIHAADESCRLDGVIATSLPASPPLTEDQQRQSEEAITVNNNLIALYQKGKYAEAAAVGELALKLRKKVFGEDHPAVAQSLNNLGTLYDSMGDYARAEVMCQRACNIRKQVFGELHPDYAVSLNNLASVYQSMGEYARAESLYVQARDIRKKVLGVENADYATSLNNLALLYQSMGEYARAESVLVQARDIYKVVYGEEHPNYGTILNNLAVLYHSMGEYAMTETLLAQACDIDKTVFGEEHPRYALTLNNLAAVYRLLGEPDSAEQLYLQSRDIFKRVLGEEHPEYAQSLNNLASMYDSRGEYARAESLYVQARDIRKKVLGEEHPSFAASLNNLAALYKSTGEYARAELLHLEAQHVLTAAAARVIPSLSEAQARNWMDKNAPRTDVLLAVLRRQQKWDSSAAYPAVWETKGLVRRLRVGHFLSSDAVPAVADAFTQLREARVKLGKLVSATPSPKQADGYHQAMAAAIERKESLEKRLAELNTATARELAVRDAQVNDLLQQLPDGVAVVDFVRLDDWQFVNNEIKFKKESGEIEIRTVKREVPRPVYDAFVLRANRSAEANPAKWIPLGPAEPIELSIAAWEAEFAPTEDTKADTSAASNEPATDPEKRLRQLIWDKLETHLDGIHTVVVIPDGALNRLPWAALPGRNDGEYLLNDYALTTAATGQQLYGVLADSPIGAKPELLVVGGIEYDQRPQSPSAQSESALLAMNSRSLVRSEKEFGWNRLPGTLVEAKAIARLWGDRGPLSELCGVKANEYSLVSLLPQSRFAHLATHGFFEKRGEVYGENLREQSLFESSSAGSLPQSSVAYRNPLLMTGIVLAGANVPPEKDDYGLPVGEDGILTAEEISGLDLRNTELVTLSACETGLGDVAAGEGVYGLTRVLHKSGVRSVLASLWKVDDLATQVLMKQFYMNLWIEKKSKVEALRNAQLWMLANADQFPANYLDRGLGANVSESVDSTKSSAPEKSGRVSPRYWAAFQLSGDFR